MKTKDWMTEVRRLARTDEWYQVWLADVNALEPEFHAICEALPPEQQEKLRDYIDARETMQSALILFFHKTASFYEKDTA